MVLAAALCSVAFAACAQAPEAGTNMPPMKTIRVIETVTVPDETPAAEGDQRPIVNVIKQAEVKCVQEAGSRIWTRNRAGTCNDLSGKSYDRKDLESRQMRTLLW